MQEKDTLTRSIHALLPGAVHPAALLALMIGFLVLGLRSRFVIPRYDYWDVVYESTTIIERGDFHFGKLLSILQTPVADQLMALPKFTIFLTNHLARQHVILLEVILAWALLLIGYLLLMSILRLPFFRRESSNTRETVKILVVFLVYWWPATLPTLTNNWFAVQYSLVLTSGLASIYYFFVSQQNTFRLALGCVYFLLCALSHGTGLLLGPVLATWLFVKRRAPMWVLLFLSLTTLPLIGLTAIQQQIISLPGNNVDFSLTSVKLLLRIITPPFWEQAIFILFIVPLLVLAFSQLRFKETNSSCGGCEAILLWSILVWIATFVARYNLMDHANPHYLRFFVLLYAVLVITLIDRKILLRKKWIATLVGAIFLAVWIKGTEWGISTAHAYRAQNLQGYSSLVEDRTVENSSTNYVYPMQNRRLTNVLIPGLVNYQPYGYIELLGLITESE